MTPLWLYLYFPALQLDSLFQSPQQASGTMQIDTASGTAALPQAPLCLVDSQTLLVKQSNATATQQGIHTGMTLSMACALCHDLQVLPYQVEQELQYLQQVATLLYQVSADIALDPPCALWLRLESMLTLYGGLTPYLAVLSEQLSLLQLQSQLALANSAAAAKLLCFSQPGLLSTDPDRLRAALNKSPLSLSTLSETTGGQSILQQLHSTGIRTLGQLLAIPRPELSRRFSATLIAMLDELSGHRPSVRQFYQPPEQFCQSLELLYLLEHSQQMLAPLTYLLKLLQNYLQLRDQHCYQLQLKLELKDHPPLVLQLQSACGEYQQSRWLALFELRLQSLKLPAPISKMQLTACQTTARDGDNLSLLNNRNPDPADSYNQQRQQRPPLTPMSAADGMRLRSLLTAKLGADRVQQPVLQADHRPELANGYQSLGFSPRANVTVPAYPPQTPALLSATSLQSLGNLKLPALRPSLILAQPIPLRMQLQLQPGLERICTGWWDQHPIQRDYYIGRNQDGQWCWVFKNASGWYLQGYFA